jgi:hypothetical protein
MTRDFGITIIMIIVDATTKCGQTKDKSDAHVDCLRQEKEWIFGKSSQANSSQGNGLNYQEWLLP